MQMNHAIPRNAAAAMEDGRSANSGALGLLGSPSKAMMASGRRCFLGGCRGGARVENAEGCKAMRYGEGVYCCGTISVAESVVAWACLPQSPSR